MARGRGWAGRLGLAIGLTVALGTPPVRAAELWTIDGSGRVATAELSRASLQRTPPEPEPVDPTEPHGDPDALRYLLVGSERELPSVVDLIATDAEGDIVDRIEGLPLTIVPCPRSSPALSSPALSSPAAEASCAVTPPVRAVVDDVDADHPLVARRSVRAALGGQIAIMAGGHRLGGVAVGGPRDTALGPIERLRARLRVIFVRLAPGGAVPVGGDRQGAEMAARHALARVNGLWGACGIGFGPPESLDIDVVDPPPPHLISIGCGHGLPASGGRLTFVVDDRRVAVEVAAGMSPAEVARRVAERVERAGFSVQVYDNPAIAAAAGASSDLSIRRSDGELATITRPPGHRLSTDPTLTACIGSVELEDGLQHFGNVDAMVGTLEERTLVKALDDHDPRTIEVILVPGFGRGGRIGESFIGADGGALRNVVIVDRAAIRSNQASFTLAHEIGHVLLDDPGHPDDFGRDTPTRLMDADAAETSAFGPRRLSVSECERVLRQSGPQAPVPLLEPWPIETRE